MSISIGIGSEMTSKVSHCTLEYMWNYLETYILGSLGSFSSSETEMRVLAGQVPVYGFGQSTLKCRELGILADSQFDQCPEGDLR